MPIYRVQTPDGGVMKIEAPEGATQDQVLAFAQQQYQQQQQSSPDKMALLLEAERRGILPPAKAALLNEARSRGLVGPPSMIRVDLPDGNVAEFPADTSPEVVERAVQQYGAETPSRLQQIEQALRKADAAGNVEDARALAQAYAEERDRKQSPRADFTGVTGRASSVPAARQAEQGYWRQRFDELESVGNGVRMSVAGTALGVGQLLGVAKPENEEAYRSNRERFSQQGGPWFDRGQFVGDALQTAVPISRVGTAGRVANYAGAAATGGAFGATRPVVDQGDSRMANTAAYGAAGVLGQGIAHGLSAVGRKAPEAIRELYEAARARGIELTPAQLTDSTAFRFFQSQLGRLPFSGATGRAAKERQAWNRALAREIGEDADAVTPEVYARAKQRHSAQFEELAGRNKLSVTDNLLQRLEDIKAEASMLGDDTARATANAVDALYRRVQAGDVVPGRVYQALDAQLGRAAKVGNEASVYVGRVRDAIREAMDGSISAGDQAAWRELRRQYGNRKTIRDLVAKESGEDIAPRALMARVNATSAGKERMATGTRGEIGTLARVGQRMTEPPTSGTAERLMMLGTGAGAYANAPMTLAALLSGRVARQTLDSSALTRLLMGPNRGQYLQPAAHIGRPLPLMAGTVADDRAQP